MIRKFGWLAMLLVVAVGVFVGTRKHKHYAVAEIRSWSEV